MLAEAASIPYRVTDIIYDEADDTLIYYKVETEGGRQGLYDSEGVQILAPYYNDIYSLDGNRFAVSLRGAIGVLEYKNEKLHKVIDYAYSNVISLPDGGYIMTDGNGESTLYENDRVVLKKPIQSHKVIVNYSVSEDGSLKMTYDILISSGGVLYVHRGEYSHEAKSTVREAPEMYFDSIENERALLVRYHEKGRISAEDVIYPTEYYRSVFELRASAEDSGWYLEEDADKQGEPVTKESILAFGDNMIDLYPKVSEK